MVHSSVLKSSESLCKLLHYLAERSLDQPGGIKEYQIATEVFGRRSADFDPRLDATVRVQTSRLRAKLVEYYAVEGVEDPWILELPKGSYTMTVHARPPAEIPPPVPPPAPPSPVTFQPVRPFATGGTRPSTAIFWVLSLLCIGLLATLVFVISRRPAGQVASVSARVPQSLQNFWRAFIDQPEPPLVVFSNAEFVGRPESGIRYFNPALDSRGSILDHYTGVGEVIAIHELDRVFTLMRHDIRVKRGRLLSLDDVKNTNLVFVGSPTENLTLREIATTREFTFRNEPGGARKGDLAVFNPNPRPGEDKTYLGTAGVPLNEDYAVIAVFPGAYPPFQVMILAGTSTIGTQAAVEFVCHEAEVRELVSKIGVSKTGEVLPFEAVIRVKVSHGVPVESKLVALHARTAQ